MIDASKDCIKDDKKNRLCEQDIHKIVDTFTRQAEFPHYSRMVPVAEISDSKNNHNLNLALHRLQQARGSARSQRTPERRHPQP